MLVKKGLWIALAPFAPRVRSQTSVFTGFGEGRSRLVQAKHSLVTFFAAKNNGFYIFKLKTNSEPPGASWVSPGCLWAPPGCLLGAS